MYPYGWFMLMFGKNQQNSVKQLSFNKKEKKKRIMLKKKKKNTFWYIRANKGWRNSCWWRKQMFPNSLSWFLNNNADQCQSILREIYIHISFFFSFLVSFKKQMCLLQKQKSSSNQKKIQVIKNNTFSFFLLICLQNLENLLVTKLFFIFQ